MHDDRLIDSFVASQLKPLLTVKKKKKKKKKNKKKKKKKKKKKAAIWARTENQRRETFGHEVTTGDHSL